MQFWLEQRYTQKHLYIIHDMLSWFDQCGSDVCIWITGTSLIHQHENGVVPRGMIIEVACVQIWQFLRRPFSRECFYSSNTTALKSEHVRIFSCYDRLSSLKVDILVF